MANRYWVGGTAQWDASGLRWSATSGGPGGAGEPSAADDVFFDANSGTGTCTISGNREAKSVNFTGYTGTLASIGSAILNVFGDVTFSSGMTVSLNTTSDIRFKASATLISAGKTLAFVMVEGAGITLTLGDSLTVSTASEFNLKEGTLNLNNYNLSTGLFQSSNTNTRSIAFGSGNIALTSTTASTTVLIMGNAAGFSWTGTGGFTRNQAATATVTFGSTGGGTASNAPNLTVNAGSSALTITSGSYFKNLNFTGSTCTVTASSLNMAGNLTLASGGTYTSVVPTFIASGTITSNGKALSSTTINGSGITVTLADAFSCAGFNLTLTQGTFTAANFNVTCGGFVSNNTNTRTLNMGSGTWTMTSFPGSGSWTTTTTTGFTLVPSTSTINMASATAKTFSGGGLTYYNLNQGGAGALTISGSNTFNNITNSVQPATVTFTAGTTQTVSAFGLSGTAGNLVTINSTTPGSQATLSKASGSVTVAFCTIRDSNATGGATWNAPSSVVSLGNNTGWLFANSGQGMVIFF